MNELGLYAFSQRRTDHLIFYT